IVTAGNLLSFAVEATSANTPAPSLFFSLEEGFPVGASITPGGVFSWTPSPLQAPSTNVITVRVVDDSVPPLSATASFKVVVNQGNVAPVLAPIADWTVTAGSLLSFSVSASDADQPAQTLSFSLDPGFPAGASITPAGVFSWSPTAAQASSTNVITVRVT